jgi:hypothetical protein
LNNLPQDSLHVDIRVLGVPDPHIGAVEVNGVKLSNAIGETSSVKVGLDGANTQDEIGCLNSLTDSRIGAVSGLNTPEVLVRLVHGSLAHGGYEGWQT